MRLAIEQLKAEVSAVSSASEKLGRAMAASLDRMLEFATRKPAGLEPWEQRLIKEAATDVLKLGVRVREAQLREQESENLAEYQAAVGEFEESRQRQIEGRRKRKAEGETG